MLSLPTLYLLAVVTAASGESGWVLWGQTVDPWNGLVALPLGRWASREACEGARLEREHAAPELRMSSYVCLPDSPGHGPAGPPRAEGRAARERAMT